jgi:hypothetical protein
LTNLAACPMNERMRHGVQITTIRKRDADCICEALTGYGCIVERAGKRWSVDLSRSDTRDLPDLLTALKACLDENAIGAVKVAIDGQAYAMEGVA